MKAMAARMIFHLLSMPNRQVYDHMLTYIELSVSPLHNGVKIFLMRDDAGIVTFSCNNKAKNIFFRTFFLLTPLYYLPLTEFNSIFFSPPHSKRYKRVKFMKNHSFFSSEFPISAIVRGGLY